MAGSKIKIEKATMAKIIKAVEQAGYASVEEFVETAIERELRRAEASNGFSSEAEVHIHDRLRGLGYLE